MKKTSIDTRQVPVVGRRTNGKPVEQGHVARNCSKCGAETHNKPEVMDLAELAAKEKKFPVILYCVECAEPLFRYIAAGGGELVGTPYDVLSAAPQMKRFQKDQLESN